MEGTHGHDPIREGPGRAKGESAAHAIAGEGDLAGDRLGLLVQPGPAPPIASTGGPPHFLEG